MKQQHNRDERRDQRASGRTIYKSEASCDVAMTITGHLQRKELDIIAQDNNTAMDLDDELRKTSAKHTHRVTKCLLWQEHCQILVMRMHARDVIKFKATVICKKKCFTIIETCTVLKMYVGQQWRACRSGEASHPMRNPDFQLASIDVYLTRHTPKQKLTVTTPIASRVHTGAPHRNRQINTS